jgi:hypothetical protein
LGIDLMPDSDDALDAAPTQPTRRSDQTSNGTRPGSLHPIDGQEIGRHLQGWRSQSDGPDGSWTVESLQRENDNLRRALTSRVVIEQAKGILMLRYDLDEGQAFALLTRWSQQTNIKLRVIAGAVVDVISHKDLGAEIEPTLAGELNRLLWPGGPSAG